MHPFLVYLCLSMGSIIVAIGAMFGEVAAIDKSSMKVGLSTFVLSMSGGSFCSLASFFIGGLLADPAVLVNSELDIHSFSVLYLGIVYGTMTLLWLLFWLCSSILGAIMGGVVGIKLYQFYQRHS